jgi:hypothetical protein
MIVLPSTTVARIRNDSVVVKYNSKMDERAGPISPQLIENQCFSGNC